MKYKIYRRKKGLKGEVTYSKDKPYIFNPAYRRSDDIIDINKFVLYNPKMIDNVLEKIVTHPQSEELLSVINPVRIGKDEAVASDYVKPFVHSNVKSGVNAEYEEILKNTNNCSTHKIKAVI